MITILINCFLFQYIFVIEKKNLFLYWQSWIFRSHNKYG